MAMTYTDLVESVRDWSNRDIEALPNRIIQQGLRWSADTAYRELQTPPLEYTQEYVLLGPSEDPDSTLLPENVQQVEITTAGGLVGLVHANLPIPADLTTFIQIRIIGTASKDPEEPQGINPDTLEPYPTRFLKLSNGILDVGGSSARSGIVFNEKTDIRTFYDARSPKVSAFFWSRQQNDILAAGRLAPGDIIEVLYYRRLPALDARYKLETTDYTAESTDDDGIVTPESFTSFVDISTLIVSTVRPTTAQITALGLDNPSLTPDDFSLLGEDWYAGIHIDHWLRDQNERILIFGALWQAFDYLGDDAMGQKYAQKYQLEMQEINKEELRRKASGGNTQVHYSSNLI